MKMLKKMLTLFLIAITLSSCDNLETKDAMFSCESSDIDCYRFDYQSIDSFRSSVEDHSLRWGLSSPTDRLDSLIINQNIDIYGANEGVELIQSQPWLMFSFGQYIEKYNKPREWLFYSEQAFIRSWNSLTR